MKYIALLPLLCSCMTTQTRSVRPSYPVQLHDGLHRYLFNYCEPVRYLEATAYGFGKSACAKEARLKIQKEAREKLINHISIQGAVVAKPRLAYRVEGLGFNCKPFYREELDYTRFIMPPWSELEPDLHGQELSLAAMATLKKEIEFQLVTNRSGAPCFETARYREETASVYCDFDGTQSFNLPFEVMVEAAKSPVFAVTFDNQRVAKFSTTGLKKFIAAIQNSRSP